MPTLIVDIETPTGSITEEIEIDDAEYASADPLERENMLADTAEITFHNACNYGFHLKEV